jgi:aromatic-amino-acid transaminase
MTHSFFSDIPQAAPDAILGVTEAFRADTHPSKVNLGVGIYQNSDGKVPVLDSVSKASALWLSQEDTKAYLPIDGVAAFNQATQQLIFGKDSSLLAEKRVATVQSVGGSGALKLGADFIKRFFPSSALYLSDPSWENHRVIFEAAHLEVKTYPYYNPETNGVKTSEMLEALRGLPAQSVVLLHGCCHNPTGVDLAPQTWEEIASICAERNLIPFIDFAYQGFAEGLVEDAAPIRLFAQRGLTFLVASSFAKSLALYRERVGALSIVTGSAQEASAVVSQLKRVVRTMYSSPPSFGGHVASLVLTTPELRTLWEEELTAMRVRIQQMRELFSSTLSQTVSSRDFSFILKQRGMFSYSGLAVEHIRALREQFHIYALDSGRICIAALNEKNIGYVCNAIATVLKG